MPCDRSKIPISVFKSIYSDNGFEADFYQNHYQSKIKYGKNTFV